jgi:hypothetical protein
MITETFRRTSGRTSAASVPSLASTSIVSCVAARLAMTWLMRESSARASRSISSSSLTLSRSSSDSTGSIGR